MAMAMARMGRAENRTALAGMISDFNVEEGGPGRIAPEGVDELCFCDRPLTWATP
jgi:hypothetical protein